MSQSTSNLQIDSARLWGTIHETAKFGATPKGGVRRLTLGPEDKQVRDWFRSACEAAGLEVHVDTLGSMFGLRRGRDVSKLPVGLGSHLDTQPTGGKYDGVLGTLAALEVVRTLNDAGIETDAPICIVNWTNEEGSRFAPAMMASAAYVGDFTTDDILSRKDADGVTVAEKSVPPLTLDDIERAFAPFRGDLQQIPPMVSAVKHQGQPLYKLARKGKVVERAPRSIHIYDLRPLRFESPSIEFRVTCSKGTYVRTLCADIGDTLGCGAHLAGLRRTRSGSFDVKNAHRLEDLLKLARPQLQPLIIPILQLVTTPS